MTRMEEQLREMPVEQAISVYLFWRLNTTTTMTEEEEAAYWTARGICHTLLYETKYLYYYMAFPSGEMTSEENDNYESHSAEEENRRTGLRDQCVKIIREVLEYCPS